MSARKVNTSQAAELTGLTCRKVDYYCRMGWMGARFMDMGSGNRPRRFTERDIRILKAIGQLTIGTGIGGHSRSTMPVVLPRLIEWIDSETSGWFHMGRYGHEPAPHECRVSIHRASLDITAGQRDLTTAL